MNCIKGQKDMIPKDESPGLEMSNATGEEQTEENYQYPNRFCIHYVSNSGRPSSDHRTGKGQSSFQFPRRVVLKNVLTIGQLHSSPMVVRSCLKSCMLGFRFM